MHDTERNNNEKWKKKIFNTFITYTEHDKSAVASRRRMMVYNENKSSFTPNQFNENQNSIRPPTDGGSRKHCSNAFCLVQFCNVDASVCHKTPFIPSAAESAMKL